MNHKFPLWHTIATFVSLIFWAINVYFSVHCEDTLSSRHDTNAFLAFLGIQAAAHAQFSLYFAGPIGAISSGLYTWAQIALNYHRMLYGFCDPAFIAELKEEELRCSFDENCSPNSPGERAGWTVLSFFVFFLPYITATIWAACAKESNCQPGCAWYLGFPKNNRVHPQPSAEVVPPVPTQMTQVASAAEEGRAGYRPSSPTGTERNNAMPPPAPRPPTPPTPPTPPRESYPAPF